MLLSPIAERGAEKDPIYEFVKREQAVKDRLEETRLLYVACTRAIKRLSLVGCAQCEPGTQDLKAPAASALLSRIWDSIAAQAQIIQPSSPVPLHTPPVAALKRLRFTEE